MRKTIKRTGFIAVSAVALTSVGVAYAAWTATGSGNGKAASQDKVLVTVGGTAGAGDLYPGALGDVVVTVTNTAPYKVALSALAPQAATSLLPANCALTYEWTSKSLSTVLATGESQTFIVNDGVKMGDGSVDSCAAISFDIPVTVTAGSTPASNPSTASATSIVL